MVRLGALSNPARESGIGDNTRAWWLGRFVSVRASMLFAVRGEGQWVLEDCCVPAHYSIARISSRILPDGTLTSVTSVIRLPNRLFPMGETLEIFP